MNERGIREARLLFATTLHSGFLGILLSLSRTPLYPTQGFAAANWGFSPLEDQQLAGLIMWVPGGIICLAASLALAALWIGGSSASLHEDKQHGLLAP
ncbi:cytochrome c oxidase assembly protein [Ensifer sp. IC3342]|nr:cytochrome c oxidase assembly protein [Ensifer sp. BRP08]MCA1450904.1 cytochrome c oxidase assembly protein [Ensifer sp. IC3342]